MTAHLQRAGQPASPDLPRAVTRAAWAGLAIVLSVYVWRLHDAPAAIGGDEAFFANHGFAMATTGADLNGRRWPLLIQVDPDIDPGLWYQAFLVYLEALTFTVLPFAEWSARLPVALLAIANVALAWTVAARYTRQPIAGPIGAMVMALSPIHFFLARQALDYICPIVFVLLWLDVLSRLDDRPRLRTAFVCGLILGAGLFSYVSSWLMMPVYLVCTVAVCLSKPRRWALAAAAAAGFGVFAAMLGVWLVAHPDAWTSVMRRYAGQSFQLPGLNINGYYRLVDFVTAYWTAWNPAQLFLVGSPNPTIGVRSAGVFVAPVAILFVAGLVAIARPSLRHLVLIAGLLSAPLGPVLYGTPDAIQRQLVLLPFVAIVSALGAAHLWAGGTARRVLLVMVIVSGPLVFAKAVSDVFAGRLDYVTRFDPSNFRELTPALAALDRQVPAPQVVLAIGPYDRRAYWRFYTTMGGHTLLQSKAVFWEPQSFRADDVAADSLVVASEPSELASVLDRGCQRVAVVRGEAAMAVWRAAGAGCLVKP